MTPAARRSILAALAVLTVVGLLTQAREASRLRGELEATSFGKAQLGYGALFDLLTELEIPAVRSFAPPADLPAGATVWWLEPTELCADSAESAFAEEDDRLLAWIEAGGTAVLFLGNAPCASVAGLMLPVSDHRAAAPPVEKSSPAVAPAPQRVPKIHPRDRHEPDDAAVVMVTGSVVARPRAIRAPELTTFEATADWQTVAAIDARPFAVERPLGAGRMVLVADVTFARNVSLDRGDAAPLAIDFVRAFGAPILDERAHGLRPSRSAFAYLARSPAWPLFAGLALLALLVSWRGSSIPPFTARAPRRAAPTLEAFVDSLATLYARSQDFAQVASRYRELTAERLRRQFGLQAETPLAALTDRLRVDPRVTPTSLRALTEDHGVGNEPELRAAVRLLDSIVPGSSTTDEH